MSENNDWMNEKPNWASIGPVPARIPVPDGMAPRFPSAAVEGDASSKGGMLGGDSPSTPPGAVYEVYGLYSKDGIGGPKLCRLSIMLQGEPEEA